MIKPASRPSDRNQSPMARNTRNSWVAPPGSAPSTRAWPSISAAPGARRPSTATSIGTATRIMGPRIPDATRDRRSGFVTSPPHPSEPDAEPMPMASRWFGEAPVLAHSRRISSNPAMAMVTRFTSSTSRTVSIFRPGRSERYCSAVLGEVKKFTLLQNDSRMSSGSTLVT